MSRRRRGLGLIGLGLVGLVLAAASAGTAAQGAAPPAVLPAVVPVSETGVPGYLRLGSDWVEPVVLAAGEVHRWRVRVDLDDAPAAALGLRIAREGALVERADGLAVSIRQCADEWSGPATAPICPAGERLALARTPLADAALGQLGVAAAPGDDLGSLPLTTLDLGTMAADRGEHLLVELGLPASAANDTSLMGLEATIALGIIGQDAPPPAPAPAPPVTAPAPLDALPATGVGLLAAALLAASLLAILTGARLVRV